MSSQLAANHYNQQQAEQEERMRMKKLTLDINERQEQEDYQGNNVFPCYVPCYALLVLIHTGMHCIISFVIQLFQSLSPNPPQGIESSNLCHISAV